MRTRRPLVPVTIAALALSACGGAAGLGGTSSTALSTRYTDALPPAGQLAAGTYNLEGTALAIDADQAVRLLPLWQGLLSLLKSSTSSSQEIQAVIAQIEDAMTADQVAAISTMQLTQADLQGLLSSGTDSSTNGSQTRSDGFAFGGPGSDGGVFMGGGPGGANLSGLPGSTTLSGQSTQVSSQNLAAKTSADPLSEIGVNAQIVRAVIAWLQSKLA